MKQVNKYRILSVVFMASSVALGLVAIPAWGKAGFLAEAIVATLVSLFFYLMFTVWAVSVFRDHNGDECSINLDRHGELYGMKRKWFGLEPDHQFAERIVKTFREFHK